jgi:hypothetical protein
LIDVIVLVFARSELRELVGTDALRSVLEGLQRQLFPDPNTIALQVVWELLESQPGFQAEHALAPICRLKSWETSLDVKVVLPDGLEGLDDAQTCATKALECRVSEADLAAVLRPPTVTTPIPLSRVLPTTSKQPSKHNKPSAREWISVVAAVLCVGAAVFTISSKLRDPGISQVSPSDISDEIPFSKARKVGDTIEAVLADPSWANKPEAERRQQLEASGPRLRGQSATRLMVLDGRGAPVASFMLEPVPFVITFPARP